MKNPWLEISVENTLLECDKEIINDHNNNPKLKSDSEIVTDIWPEPYIGDPNAEIYLLLGNPGINNDIYKRQEMKDFFNDNKDIFLKNLRHETTGMDYPLYYLDDNFNKHQDGYNWWKKAVKNLVKETGSGLEKIAKNIFVVETYGYHSVSLQYRILKGKNKLKSSEYSFYLVDKAIEENKLIIVGRSVRIWLENVKKLEKYDKCCFLASNRGIDLSKTTISPFIFNEMKQFLKK